MRRLDTDRLVIRPSHPDDAPFMLQLLNEPGFLTNIGDRGVTTVEEARAYLRTAPLFAYEPGGLGFNIVEERETGEPVGICGLVKRDVLDDVDVGYAMLERAAGRGYASEAAAAVLKHAREDLGLTRVVAITGVGNAGSRRVLEKLGLELESVLELSGYAGETCLYATPS